MTTIPLREDSGVFGPAQAESMWLHIACIRDQEGDHDGARRARNNAAGYAGRELFEAPRVVVVEDRPTDSISSAQEAIDDAVEKLDSLATDLHRNREIYGDEAATFLVQAEAEIKDATASVKHAGDEIDAVSGWLEGLDTLYVEAD